MDNNAAESNSHTETQQTPKDETENVQGLGMELINNVEAIVTDHEKGNLTTEEFLEKRLETDGPIFYNSCHREFVYCGYTRSLSAFFLSSMVLTIQTAIYGVFLNEAIKKITEDHVDVELSWQTCNDYTTYTSKLGSQNETASIDDYVENVIAELYSQLILNISNVDYFNYNETFDKTSLLLNSLECEAEYPENMWIAALLPAILLAAYTTPDLINGVRTMFIVDGKWAKFASCIILLENLLALVVGTCWAFQGYWKGNSYDSIINCMLS